MTHSDDRRRLRLQEVEADEACPYTATEVDAALDTLVREARQYAIAIDVNLLDLRAFRDGGTAVLVAATDLGTGRPDNDAVSFRVPIRTLH